jgi:hypothetical protein
MSYESIFAWGLILGILGAFSKWLKSFIRYYKFRERIRKKGIPSLEEQIEINERLKKL